MLNLDIGSTTEEEGYITGTTRVGRVGVLYLVVVVAWGTES